MSRAITLTKLEASILADVLGMVLNDPDWQESAAATDAEWNALRNAHTKIAAVAR